MLAFVNFQSMLLHVPKPRLIKLGEDDRDESALSRVAEKFRVVLFGAGKTLYAPPDQPALQVLLQYRNLYELTMSDIQHTVQEHKRVSASDFNRASSLLDKMWHVILECMREYNRATNARARLLQAERFQAMRYSPQLHTVPNPAFDTSYNKPDNHLEISEPIILDPTDSDT